MLFQFDRTTAHTAAIIFVAKAVEKKDQSKFNLLHVYCDGSRVYATDGHRLHLYAPTDCPLTIGYYKILKRNKTSIDLVKIDESMQYPEVDRVIPKEDKVSYFQPAKKVDGSYPDIKPVNVSEFLKLAQVLRATEDGTFNIDYFREACGGMSSFSQKDSLSPLLMRGGETLAVIMPTRV